MGAALWVYAVFVLLVAAAIALCRIPSSRLGNRWGFGLWGVAAAAFLWTVSEPAGLFDDFFKAYEWAGRLVLTRPSMLYDGAGRFTNIPLIALFFVPLAALPKRAAGWCFLWLGVLAVVAAAALLARLSRLRGRQRLALASLFLLNGPLYYSLREGNLSHFVLLLLVASLAFREAGMDFPAGVSLAVAAAIKPPLALLGCYYFFRKRWTVAIGFAATGIAIGGVSLLLFGLPLHLRWWAYSIEPFRASPLLAFNVQSIDAALARLVTHGHLFDWRPVEMGLTYSVFRYGVTSILLGGTLWVCFVGENDPSPAVERLELSIVLCLALLVSPVSWTHYYLWLLIPYALALGEGRGVVDGPMAAGGLLASLPVLRIGAHTLVGRAAVSHYAIGAIVLLFTLWRARLYQRPSPERLVA